MTDILYTYYQQYGKKIFLKYRKNGNSFSKQIDFYKPHLYTKSEDSTCDAKSIYGHALTRIDFENLKEAKDFVFRYKDVDGFEIEGNSDFGNQFIIDMYKGQMPSFDPKKIRSGILDIEVHAPEFPQPSEAKWPINGITIYDNFTETYYCIGDKPYVHNKKDEDVGSLNVHYQECANEYDLLYAMLLHFRDFRYDLTSGWNSEQFDMPYIVNRCTKILGEKRTHEMLSPFGVVKTKTKIDRKFNTEYQAVDIYGMPHLDYMRLYKKHIFTPRESYKLDHIGFEELGIRKLSYDEEGSLQELYNKNPQKFYAYNIRDVDIVKQLDDKLGLFNITYTLAYYTLGNYSDTLGTVDIWQKLIAKHLFNNGKVPLFSSERGEKEKFQGAFVHPTIVGKHRWVVSVDLNSLYSMIEIQYNISTETYIQREKLPKELSELKSKYTLDDLVNGKADLSVLKKYNYAMTGNFEFYEKSFQGFMSEIKENLYADRKVNKKKMLAAQAIVEEIKTKMLKEGEDQESIFHMKEQESISILYDNLQMAMKILLNAGYGAVGNVYFLYYAKQNAEAITLSGQLINKWTHVRINEFLNTLLNTPGKIRTVAGDTDSLYLCLDDIVKKMNIEHLSDNEIADKLDEFMKKILSPKIDKISDELCEYMNAVKNKMVWEREAIASVAIYVRKKAYVMKVVDSEGVRYDPPKIKMKGLEAVKAGAYPQWARKFLKECYTIAIEHDDERVLQKKIKELEKTFYELDVNEIASPRSVNHIEKYLDVETGLWIKGTQKHIRAAILFNWLCDKKNLPLEKITSGTKIKFIDLKEPNPLHQDVIGFRTFLPKEFELEKYIDRESIYEKTFIEALSIFLKAINWNWKETIKLSDFFS